MRKYALVLVVMAFAFGLLACPPQKPPEPTYNAQADYDAAVAMMQSDPAGAKAMFEKVVANAGEGQEGIKDLALKKIDECDKLIAEEMDPAKKKEEAAKLVEEARSLIKDGMVNKAFDKLSEAIDLDVENDEAKKLIARAYFIKSEAAIKDGKGGWNDVDKGLDFLFKVGTLEDDWLKDDIKAYALKTPQASFVTFLWSLRNDQPELGWKILTGRAKGEYYQNGMSKFKGKTAGVKNDLTSGTVKQDITMEKINEGTVKLKLGAGDKYWVEMKKWEGMWLIEKMSARFYK